MIQTTRKIKAITLRPEENCAALRSDAGSFRRVLKPQPASKLAYCSMGYQHGKWGYPAPKVYEEWGDDYRIPDGLSPDELNRRWNPPCHGDDILYVRETWRVQAAHRFEANVRIEYKAGGPMYVIQFPGHKSDSINRTQYDQFISKWADDKWHSPVGMPREAARLFLLIKHVNMARLRLWTKVILFFIVENAWMMEHGCMVAIMEIAR